MRYPDSQPGYGGVGRNERMEVLDMPDDPKPQANGKPTAPQDQQSRRPQLSDMIRVSRESDPFKAGKLRE
jgi:hypothetical protein